MNAKREFSQLKMINFLVISILVIVITLQFIFHLVYNSPVIGDAITSWEVIGQYTINCVVWDL